MQQQGRCEQTNIAETDLYHRFASAIFAYARLHSASWEDAEDLTIDVFLSAYEHNRLSWMTEQQQLIWLRRVAHNKLIDRYRRTTRCTVVPLEQIIEQVLHDESPTPEQLLLRRETLQQLYQAVEKLPVLQQQLIQLRFGDELSFAEIAILLQKKEPAIRKLYSRTLARLRALYSRNL
jgi:RNA polymerase sigma factor (sigma-70 family)